MMQRRVLVSAEQQQYTIPPAVSLTPSQSAPQTAYRLDMATHLMQLQSSLASLKVQLDSQQAQLNFHQKQLSELSAYIQHVIDPKDLELSNVTSAHSIRIKELTSHMQNMYTHILRMQQTPQLQQQQTQQVTSSYVNTSPLTPLSSASSPSVTELYPTAQPAVIPPFATHRNSFHYNNEPSPPLAIRIDNDNIGGNTILENINPCNQTR